MHILTAEQTREADRYTIEHEPIASIELMERAATRATDWIQNFLRDYPRYDRVEVVCGIGNNGGDGLVIARQLSQFQERPVRVTVARFSDSTSEDFQRNYERLQEQEVEICDAHTPEDFPDFSDSALRIDAVFGSGLNRPVEGGVAEAAVHSLNRSGGSVIAIDIPSGLFAEDNDENTPETIVRATHTLTFERPKLAMLLDANAPFVGTWHRLPIGLHRDFLEQVDSPYRLLTPRQARSHYRPRTRFSHKGTYGRAHLLLGGRGKMGAAVLATHACLRAGIGLLTVQVPQCGVDVIHATLPEAMVEADPGTDCITKVSQEINQYDAIGGGCGWGTSPQTERALYQLLRRVEKPLVLDADALNLLARNPDWLALLPQGSLLTPHPKEFERLTGKAHPPYAQLQQQREWAQRYGICLIVKGAFTRIALPDGTVWFNYETGNAGMATGGSGDALTGILTALLAQGYPPAAAAQLGVYLHGKAGDAAAATQSPEAMLPSDLIMHLGAAFRSLGGNE